MARRRPGSTNRVRLIGGRHGGRWLAFPDAEGLRPTSDRIRETLFNWLQPQIEGARCLDLFAGSGAIGFEAASRGAGQVVMLEQSPKVVASLRHNQQSLALEQVEIIQTDSLRWLDQSRGGFDLVFADPPFAAALLPRVLHRLVEMDCLNTHARVYWEMDAADALPEWPQGLQPLRDKRAGQVRYGLLAT